MSVNSPLISDPSPPLQPAGIDPRTLASCRRCGLIQTLPAFPAQGRFRCARCHDRLRTDPNGRPRSHSRTSALALGALILFPIAMTMPIIRVERLGHSHSSTILSGVVDLFAEGSFFVAVIVLLCSVLVPLAKLLGLLAICAGDAVFHHRHRAAAYRLIEWIGRWGMVDVLLVALLVAAVKLGDVVQVHPGPGVVAFTGVVVLSLAASAAFDPAAIVNHHQARP